MQELRAPTDRSAPDTFSLQRPNIPAESQLAFQCTSSFTPSYIPCLPFEFYWTSRAPQLRSVFCFAHDRGSHFLAPRNPPMCRWGLCDVRDGFPTLLSITACILAHLIFAYPPGISQNSVPAGLYLIAAKIPVPVKHRRQDLHIYPHYSRSS